VHLPLLGGTLVPSPQASLPFVTDAAGAAALTGFVWPAPASGVQLFAQAWILDPTAAQGVAASNAIQGVAP
jgi:hypothetical protein